MLTIQAIIVAITAALAVRTSFALAALDGDLKNKHRALEAHVAALEARNSDGSEK